MSNFLRRHHHWSQLLHFLGCFKVGSRIYLADISFQPLRHHPITQRHQCPGPSLSQLVLSGLEMVLHSFWNFVRLWIFEYDSFLEFLRRFHSIEIHKCRTEGSLIFWPYCSGDGAFHGILFKYASNSKTTFHNNVFYHIGLDFSDGMCLRHG